MKREMIFISYMSALHKLESDLHGGNYGKEI